MWTHSGEEILKSDSSSYHLDTNLTSILHSTCVGTRRQHDVSTMRTVLTFFFSFVRGTHFIVHPYPVSPILLFSDRNSVCSRLTAYPHHDMAVRQSTRHRRDSRSDFKQGTRHRRHLCRLNTTSANDVVGRRTLEAETSCSLPHLSRTPSYAR